MNRRTNHQIIQPYFSGLREFRERHEERHRLAELDSLLAGPYSPAEDTFKTLPVWDSFDPTSARRTARAIGEIRDRINRIFRMVRSAV